jgi:PAS domain-containing protein
MKRDIVLLGKRQHMTGKSKEKSKPESIPETILNSIPSGIIFCDSKNKIQFINRTYADYLGVDQNCTC